jgi:hypothetical protein
MDGYDRRRLGPAVSLQHLLDLSRSRKRSRSTCATEVERLGFVGVTFRSTRYPAASGMSAAARASA